MQRPNTFLQVTSGDKFGVLAGNQEQISKALCQERTCFFQHLFPGKSYPQNRIVPRKPAIFAIIDAFIREVERGEQSYGFAETLPSQLLRSPAEWFQQSRRC